MISFFHPAAQHLGILFSDVHLINLVYHIWFHFDALFFSALVSD